MSVVCLHSWHEICHTPIPGIYVLCYTKHAMGMCYLVSKNKTVFHIHDMKVGLVLMEMQVSLFMGYGATEPLTWLQLKSVYICAVKHQRMAEPTR